MPGVAGVAFNIGVIPLTVDSATLAGKGIAGCGGGFEVVLEVLSCTVLQMPTEPAFSNTVVQSVSDISFWNTSAWAGLAPEAEINVITNVKESKKFLNLFVWLNKEQICT
jgi:hypothetical protein